MNTNDRKEVYQQDNGVVLVIKQSHGKLIAEWVKVGNKKKPVHRQNENCRNVGQQDSLLQFPTIHNSSILAVRAFDFCLRNDLLQQQKNASLGLWRCSALLY